jgi:hypothetical protein
MTFASFIILAGLGATYMAYTKKGVTNTVVAPASANIAGNSP